MVQPILTEDTQRLLQAIYDHFYEYAGWPTWRALELKFRNDMELYEIVKNLDNRLIRCEKIYREDAVCYLTLDGLKYCKDSTKDVENIVRMSALFAKRYIDNNGTANITSDEIRDDLKLTDLEVRRACEMYHRFGWSLIGGVGIRNDNNRKVYNFTVSRYAYLFDDVRSLDDFYVSMKKVEQKEEAERRLSTLNSPQQAVSCSLADKYHWCREHAVANYTDDGRHFCVFHAPKGEKGVSLEEFNNQVFDVIKRAKMQNEKCNLSGTVFDGYISFSDFGADNPFPPIRFNYSEFNDGVDFARSMFAGYVDFQYVIFHEEVYFLEVLFKKKSVFFETTFKESASFEGAIFYDDANFSAAKFKSNAVFSTATFDKDIRFTKAEFEEVSNFWRTTFTGTTEFADAKFNKDAEFEGAAFNGEVNFSNAKFGNKTNFSNITFSKDVYFSGSKFNSQSSFLYAKWQGKAYFQGAEFSDKAYFASVEFQKATNFVKAVFYKDALFPNSVFSDIVNFTGSRFDDTAKFDSVKFNSLAIYVDVSFKENVSFEKALFDRQAQFSFASFLVASFSKAEFRDTVFFWDSVFQKKADFSDVIFAKKINFDRATFNGSAFFFGSTFVEGAILRGLNLKAKLRFEKVNLRQVSFLDTDLRMMDFVNCTWNNGYGRDVLYDETILFSDPIYEDTAIEPRTEISQLMDNGAKIVTKGLKQYVHILIGGLVNQVQSTCYRLMKRFRGPASEVLKREWLGFLKDTFAFLSKENINKVEMLYRYLKQKYKEDHDEQMVSNWHYGEKEMFRKKSLLRRYAPLSLSNLYWIACGYGEKPVRAGIFLLILVLGFSVLLAFGGLVSSTDVNLVFGITDLQGFPDALTLKKYGMLILNTLQYATFQKETIFEPRYLLSKWLKFFSQVFIPIQTTLFVVALRNRYRR